MIGIRGVTVFPFFGGLENIDLIRLFGSFLVFMKFQTLFCVTHFAISVAPHLKSRVIVLNIPEAMFPNHSIFDIDVISHSGF